MSSARSIEQLVGASTQPIAASDVSEFWRVGAQRLAGVALPIERACLTGFWADRLGYAFVGGYHAALLTLVPELVADELACLCATETDGAHPRAIQALLSPKPGTGFSLSGEKRWSTLAPLARSALVIASRGLDEQGRNRLCAVRVGLTAPGVSVEPMPETPFAPEVPHAIVRFVDVSLTPDALLPGDGYLRYLKPFRTIEDIFVHAALLGYLIGVARRSAWPAWSVERALGMLLALGALSAEDPLAPATHLALAGVIDETRRLVASLEPLWPEAAVAEQQRWQRDVALLEVAERARTARRETAWRRVRGPG